MSKIYRDWGGGGKVGRPRRYVIASGADDGNSQRRFRADSAATSSPTTTLVVAGLIFLLSFTCLVQAQQQTVNRGKSGGDRTTATWTATSLRTSETAASIGGSSSSVVSTAAATSSSAARSSAKDRDGGSGGGDRHQPQHPHPPPPPPPAVINPVVTRLNCYTRPDSKAAMVCRQWRDSNRPELQKVVVNAARDQSGRLVGGVPVELTIQDCRVSEVPDRFLSSDSLESLTLSGCLSSYSSSSDGSWQVNNKGGSFSVPGTTTTTSIRRDAFAELKFLQRLDLSGNRLTAVPESIGFVPLLTELNLENNLLTSWGMRGGGGGGASSGTGTGSWEPDTDEWFANLTSLDLGFNRLGILSSSSSSSVPASRSSSVADSGETSTSSTAAALMPMTEFSVGNGAKKSLQFLSLRSNGFAAFPEDFTTSFPQLRELDLSFNQIASIPKEAFSRMPELRTLKLDHNSLRTFYLTELPPSAALVSLEGNPLRCDCHARWLRDLLNEAETVPLSPPSSSSSSSSSTRLTSSGSRSAKSDPFFSLARGGTSNNDDRNDSRGHGGVRNSSSSMSGTSTSSSGDGHRNNNNPSLVDDAEPGRRRGHQRQQQNLPDQRFDLGLQASASEQQAESSSGTSSNSRRRARQLRQFRSTEVISRTRGLTLRIPLCQTPLLYRNWPLEKVTDAMLCPTEKSKRSTKSFFYVGNGDKNLFGADVLDAVNVIRAEQIDANSALLSWKVARPFYSSGMDWSIVYRRVGDKMNVFHETSLNNNNNNSYNRSNKQHGNNSSSASPTSSWAARDATNDRDRNKNGTVGADGTFHNMLSGLDEDTFYVVCVAIVESNNYYIHLSKCVEVKTAKAPQQLTTTEKMKAEEAAKAVTAPPLVNAEPSRLRRPDFYPESITFSPLSDSISVKWRLSSRGRSKLVLAPKKRPTSPATTTSTSSATGNPGYHSSIVHRVPLDGGGSGKSPSSPAGTSTVKTSQQSSGILVRRRQRRNTGRVSGSPVVTEDHQHNNSDEDEDPVWRISYRRFGSDEEDRVLILRNTENNKNRTLEYSIENLEPTTGYIVCFEALPYDEALETETPGATFSATRRPPPSSTLSTDDEGSNNNGGAAAGDPICRELLTLRTSAFPVTEVAVATTVSSSATVVVVVLMCCFCPGCLSMKNRRDKKKKEQQQQQQQNASCCHHHQHQQIIAVPNDGDSNHSSTDNTDSSRLNSSSSGSTTNAVAVGNIGAVNKNYVYNVTSSNNNNNHSLTSTHQLHSVLNPNYECAWPSLTGVNNSALLMARNKGQQPMSDEQTTSTTAGSGYLSPRTTLNRVVTVGEEKPQHLASFNAYYNQPRLPPVTITVPIRDDTGDRSWSSTDESVWSQIHTDRQLVDIPRATLRSRTPNGTHRRRGHRSGRHRDDSRVVGAGARSHSSHGMRVDDDNSQSWLTTSAANARKALSVGDLTLRSRSTLDFRSMTNLQATSETWYPGDPANRNNTANKAGAHRNYQNATQQHRNSPVKRKIMGKSGNTLPGAPSSTAAGMSQQHHQPGHQLLEQAGAGVSSLGYLSLPSLLHDSSPTSASDDNHPNPQHHTSYKKHSTLLNAKRLKQQQHPGSSTGGRSRRRGDPSSRDPVSDSRMNLYHTWTIPTMQEQLRQLDRSLDDPGFARSPSAGAGQYRQQRLFHVDM